MGTGVTSRAAPGTPEKQELREKQKGTSAACPAPWQPPAQRSGMQNPTRWNTGEQRPWAARQPAVQDGFTQAPPAQAALSYHFSAGNSTGTSPQLGSRVLASPDCG